MRALVVTALVGCGRLGFEPVGDAGVVGDRAIVDTATVPAVCGDGVCSGDSGELCSTCNADCATAAMVCGNGACTTGEAECYADCGPLPWPWQADAMGLLAAVNQARTMGTQCPGGTMTTAAALVYEPALEPLAREWAWETAHESWTDNVGCNGRSYFDELTAVGAVSGWKTFGATTAANAIGFLLAEQPSCDSIMSASISQLGAAGAHDILDGHVIVLR